METFESETVGLEQRGGTPEALGDQTEIEIAEMDTDPLETLLAMMGEEI